jgi:hypothetical protein
MPGTEGRSPRVSPLDLALFRNGQGCWQLSLKSRPLEAPRDGWSSHPLLKPTGSWRCGLVGSRVGYFPGVLCARLRSLTPGPPPFSSMNSIPADSKACRITAMVDRRGCPTAASNCWTVITAIPAAFARSACFHPRSPRAPLHWPVVIIVRP